MGKKRVMKYFPCSTAALLFIYMIFFFFLPGVHAAVIRGKVKSALSIKDIDTESLNKIEKQKFLKSFSVSPSGELENVIIYIDSTKSLPAFSSKNYSYRIDMFERNFIPPVLPIFKDSKVTIVNLDHFFHNVHGVQENKNIFIDNLPKFKDERVYTFSEKGIISIKCEAHLEMLAHILVLENPFFSKTDSKGTFMISNIPPGEYTLVAWHELMGEQKKKIIIKNESLKEMSFTFDQITKMSSIIDNN